MRKHQFLQIGQFDFGIQAPFPRGEVFKFRMNLFREHLGEAEPAFADPSSEECARIVRERADRNWEDYVDAKEG